MLSNLSEIMACRFRPVFVLGRRKPFRMCPPVERSHSGLVRRFANSLNCVYHRSGVLTLVCRDGVAPGARPGKKRFSYISGRLCTRTDWERKISALWVGLWVIVRRGGDAALLCSSRAGAVSVYGLVGRIVAETRAVSCSIELE
jgi:hypothetical protein